MKKQTYFSIEYFKSGLLLPATLFVFAWMAGWLRDSILFWHVSFPEAGLPPRAALLTLFVLSLLVLIQKVHEHKTFDQSFHGSAKQKIS